MQPKNRPYGLLPTHWALRWVVYAAGFGLLFGGALALILHDGTGAAIESGAVAGLVWASLGVARERRGLRARRRRGNEHNR